jgi:ankyrin repeat protein
MSCEEDIWDEDGWTWLKTERLHRAAAAGDLQQIRALLEQGCDINAFGEDLPHTPLHYAAIENRSDALRYLIEAGANVNANDEKRIGDTPLGRIADTCSFEVAEILVSAGADPTIPGWMGMTALDHSKRRSDPEGHKVHELLFETAKRLNPNWPRLQKFERDR